MRRDWKLEQREIVEASLIDTGQKMAACNNKRREHLLKTWIYIYIEATNSKEKREGSGISEQKMN